PRLPGSVDCGARSPPSDPQRRGGPEEGALPPANMLAEDPSMDPATPLPTGTVTFLFTDIEGSTQLWEQHPDAMRLALARHDACPTGAIETHQGIAFKPVGDAFSAASPTAPDAVDAAIAAQQTLRALQPSAVASAAGLALKVRIALHTGAAEARGGDYFG